MFGKKTPLPFMEKVAFKNQDGHFTARLDISYFPSQADADQAAEAMFGLMELARASYRLQQLQKANAPAEPENPNVIKFPGRRG